MRNDRETAVVTGGAGFLGSHLCDRLVESGYYVICVDNFFTGVRENVGHLLRHPRFELVRHDVTFPLYLECERVWNLACPASPVWYQKDPVGTLKTSVLGAVNMLGLAKRTGARILQASTSEVYGDPLCAVQSETYWGNVNPVGPRACYDEGKRAAETLFVDYNRQHNVDVRIARIFNTYGPRMAIDDGRVVSNFIIQALRGKPLTVYGEGMQTRSFTFVSDMVDALIYLMNTPPGITTPVNLGSGREITMLELARTIIALTDSASKVEFHDLPVDDPQQRRPDLRKANALLGWQASTALEEGLQKTIAYFRPRV